MIASYPRATSITHQAVGIPPRTRAPLSGTILALAALLLLGVGPFAADTAQALDTGTLKLMVTSCSGTPQDGALVEVEIYRAGSGIIASDSGYTQDGYVEFTFSDLQSGDKARVTSDSCSSDVATHVYVWVSQNGNTPAIWDIEDRPNAACADTWWDEQEGIINYRCD